MQILLSGASGFIGRPLTGYLRAKGHTVIPLVRKAQEGVVFWDPAHPELQGAAFEGFDTVIHLAGENIAARWTPEKKKRLVVSRCRDTAALAQILSRLKTPPKIVIAASAIGFYGDRGNELLTENSPKGVGFLPDLCAEWEAAADILKPLARVVHTRFGPVLDPNGGVLQKMLPAFRWGLGGKMGSGRQFFSWVALEDVIGAIDHILAIPTLAGAVNVVAPNAVRQGEFAKMLAHRLHRPVFFTLPAAVLWLLLGEMAEEMLLASAHVVPERLLESGYQFKQPFLEEYLRQVDLNAKTLRH